MPKSPIITHKKKKTMFNGNIPKSNCLKSSSDIENILI